MKRKVKKLISYLLTVCMLFGTLFLTSDTYAEAASVSWNFKDTDFKDLGTISSSVTVDGLTMIASSAKKMNIKKDSKTVDGVEYTYMLALGGAGCTDYRAVKVPVYGADTIKVILKSSGSETRTLVVADANGKKLGTINATSTANLGTYQYQGNAGYVYLYSAGSGINIYKIQVDSQNATVNTGSSNDNNQTSPSTGSDTTTTYSASWNFKDNDFKSLGTLSSSKTIANLVINASSAKTVKVQPDSQNVNQVAYSYTLALGGAGNTSYRSVAFPVSGNDTIKVVLRSTGSSSRTLIVADANGKQLGTITAHTQATLGTYQYSGAAGYVYLYSSNSNINLYKIQVDQNSGSSNQGSQTTNPGNTGNTGNTGSGSTSTGTSVNTSDGVVVSSYSSLISAIDKAEAAGGGKVYVSGSTISCTGQIHLNSSNANVQIIGVKNNDGTYPVLDFSSFRSSYIGKSTGDSQAGIRISGSKYTVSNLIIQKAPDTGIMIKGSSAGNNKITNCITRYNNDSGLQISSGAYSNAIRFVCSYRNCDVYTIGGNADGFAPKLGAGRGNTFYGCYAWDNADDGWDSYDKTDGLTYDLSYEQCACWNNGNPDVFTGKYDYQKGNALDSNLLLVELIKKKDSSFASNYAAKRFSLPSSSFISTKSGTISLSDWTGSKYDGNPNGFKMGSTNTTSSCVRTFKNCLSFNHKKKGFDNNNSSVTAYMTNCVSFDNGYNYYVQPLTLKKFSNIVGFGGSSKDKLPSGYSVSGSSKESQIRSTVNQTVNSIVSSCYSNKIPGEVYFNIY